MPQGRKGLYIRLALSAFLIILSGWISTAWNPISAIGGGEAAGLQLQNSNVAAVQAVVGMSFFHGIGALCSLVLLLVLGFMWVPYLYRIYLGATLALVLFLSGSNPAFAYYSQQDKAEAVGIPPNSTAFWILDQGDTANTQTQTEDAAFFDAHKVPGKIFIVPHHIFQNSGGVHVWDADYYVPDGKLILVDRTPVTQEWTADSGTGTSSKDESFKCQSNDGLNIDASVTIAVSINQKMRQHILYYFGVEPISPDPNDDYMQAHAANDPKGQNDPEVIFASEYNARSLANTMDTVGHGLVEAAVCQAIGANTLEVDNTNYNELMTSVQKNRPRLSWAARHHH